MRSAERWGSTFGYSGVAGPQAPHAGCPRGDPARSPATTSVYTHLTVKAEQLGALTINQLMSDL